MVRSYFDELCKAMQLLARDERTVFVGQAVAEHGTAMSNTFKDVPINKLVEMPVAEDMQLGFCTGMSLTGLVPICVYPRVNFLLCAISQLVLHLDKIPIYSNYTPRVIVRTAIATPEPLDPGPQHVGDYSQSLRMMLSTVRVVNLNSADTIVQEYQRALGYVGSSILIERTELYSC